MQIPQLALNEMQIGQAFHKLGKLSVEEVPHKATHMNRLLRTRSQC